MHNAHANTALVGLLRQRLGMTREDAVFWDDLTLGGPSREGAFDEVVAWLGAFPARTVKDWAVLPLVREDLQEYAAAGFTPTQVSDVLDYLWQEDSSGQLTEESLRRELAWRRSGIRPTDVIDRLARGERLPP